MRQLSRWICIGVFVLLCIGIFSFLRLFTIDSTSITYIDWQNAVEITPEGNEIPFSVSEYTNTPEIDGTYRFETVIADDLGSGNLVFETSGLALRIVLDGEEIYRSSVASHPSYTMAQAQIPLTLHSGSELIVTCTISAENYALFPPMIRFLPDGMDQTQAIAYANFYGIPAGFSAMALLLVAGLFLLSIVRKKIEWSFLPLSVALLSLCSYRLILSNGYYFLPKETVEFFTRQPFSWVASAAMIVYLIMNRRRHFWRMLAIATAVSGGALLIGYILSAIGNGYLADYLNHAVSGLFANGMHDGLLYWLTMWLAIVCAMISSYWLLHAISQDRANAHALAVKNQLMLEGYHDMERKLKQNATFRHEIRHQLTAMEALCQKEDLPALRAHLQQLRKETDATTVTFSENVMFNIILQDAAQRAQALHIAFDARVAVPKDLSITESDLCTLCMNMLDNALEAAAQVPQESDRFIHFRAEIRQGFLAIKCANRYAGTISESPQGLQSTKGDHRSHGFGISQMRQIAEKYHSLLDIHYTKEGIFTVQTALQLTKA